MTAEGGEMTATMTTTTAAAAAAGGGQHNDRGGVDNARQAGGGRHNKRVGAYDVVGGGNGGDGDSGSDSGSGSRLHSWSLGGVRGGFGGRRLFFAKFFLFGRVQYDMVQ
jgi:hypothetical protein